MWEKNRLSLVGFFTLKSESFIWMTHRNTQSFNSMAAPMYQTLFCPCVGPMQDDTPHPCEEVGYPLINSKVGCCYPPSATDADFFSKEAILMPQRPYMCSYLPITEAGNPRSSIHKLISMPHIPCFLHTPSYRRETPSNYHWSWFCSCLPIK